MSLEFFREKRFQRRHPEVFCQRMALTIPCVSSLLFHASLNPPVVLLLAARPAWHVQAQRIALSNPLALPVVKGSQRFVWTPGFQTFSRSRAHEDVERFSLHKAYQHCVQLICQHSKSIQRHHDFRCCVRFYHCCRF